MKTIRLLAKTLKECSFIPQVEDIETCHYPQYVMRINEQTTNSADFDSAEIKKNISFCFSKKIPLRHFVI